MAREKRACVCAHQLASTHEHRDWGQSTIAAPEWQKEEHVSQPLTIAPGKTVRLSDFDPRYRPRGLTKAAARAEVIANLPLIDELVYRLYAESRRALLLVLQGMDTSGKDGTIRKVMRGINPQCCQVVSFKQPSREELAHDYLWRIHKAVPPRGNVGIFNRSHYEDVLVVRVHGLVPKQKWKRRYDEINQFEKMLVDCDVKIVKIFLHISKDEQRKRLLARLKDPNRRWKFSRHDVAERELWDKYQRAYEDALTRCNTKHAPWHIVPADRKWYRNLVVSRLVLRALERMQPQFPPAEPGIEAIEIP